MIFARQVCNTVCARVCTTARKNDLAVNRDDCPSSDVWNVCKTSANVYTRREAGSRRVEMGPEDARRVRSYMIYGPLFVRGE